MRTAFPILLALLLVGLCLTAGCGQKNAEAPSPAADIDLFEFFYNGVGEDVSEAEREAVIREGYGGDSPDTDLTKCSAGERTGELVRLYYEDTFFADGWKSATPRLGEDDGYKFVSNLPCDIADVPIR